MDYSPPFIVGREADLQNTIRDLSDNELTLSENWRRGLFSSKDDHRENWYYLARLITDALLNERQPEVIYERHSYLMNMLHSLGASHLGLWIGFFMYLLFKWKLGQARLWLTVVALIVEFITIVLLSREDMRKEEVPRFLGMKVTNPAELFLGVLFFLYLSLNPGLNELFPYYMEFIDLLLLLIALYWSRSDKVCKKLVWGLTIMLITGTTIIYHSTLNPFLGNLNWPIVLATLLFTFLSLAFLKNRQNVREQLIVMEYYYIRKFLYQKG